MLKKLYERYTVAPVQVKASFWFLLCALMQRGISVITTPIFTRLLTMQEFGKYNVFNSWLGIVSVVVTLGLYYGVFTRGLIKFEEERDAFSSAMQSLCLTLIVMWLGVYLLFREFWNGIFALTTTQMLAMFLMIWTSAIFGFWAVRQRVDVKYRNLVIVTMIVSIVKPVVGVLVVMHANDKVTARILGIAFVELIVYIGFFFRDLHRGKLFFSKKFWTHALRFNLPLVPHYLSQTILSGADRIMISSMVGVREAGIYSLAYSVAQIMMLFNTAIFQTVEPWLYRKIKERKTKEIAKITYPLFMLIAGVNIMLIIFAPEIIHLFAPASYREAIWVIPPIAMSVYFSFMYTFFAVFEFYFERTKLVTLATMTGAVLNIILNYIFIPMFGYYAAGYTTLFCYIVYAVMHYLFMRNICKEKLNNEQPYSAKMILAITTVFGACGFLILGTYQFAVVRFLAVGIVTVILFFKRKKVLMILKTMMAIKNGDVF